MMHGTTNIKKMDSTVFFYGVQTGSAIKQSAEDTHHSPPYRAEVMNKWSYTSTYLACLHGMHRDKFIYTVVSCNTMEGAGFCAALFTVYMRNVCICGVCNGAISSSRYSIQPQTAGLSVENAFYVMWKWM